MIAKEGSGERRTSKWLKVGQLENPAHQSPRLYFHGLWVHLSLSTLQIFFMSDLPVLPLSPDRWTKTSHAIYLWNVHITFLFLFVFVLFFCLVSFCFFKWSIKLPHEANNGTCWAQCGIKFTWIGSLTNRNKQILHCVLSYFRSFGRVNQFLLIFRAPRMICTLSL